MCGESHKQLSFQVQVFCCHKFLKTIVSQQQPLGSIRIQQQQLRHQQQPGQLNRWVDRPVDSQQQLDRDSRLFWGPGISISLFWEQLTFPIFDRTVALYRVTQICTSNNQLGWTNFVNLVSRLNLTLVECQTFNNTS